VLMHLSRELNFDDNKFSGKQRLKGERYE
jgi:hypothetical protein